MANKDLSLNPKIEKAALNEFMDKGFRDASIHTIAKNAGVTTGALYTRYKNKDAMFSALIQKALQAMGEYPENLYKLYNHAMQTKKFEDFYKAIKSEQESHTQIIFEYYEECQLIFCKSDGSSVGKMLEDGLQNKIISTVTFMQNISKKEIDAELIELILTQTMNIYKYILEKNYSKAQAINFIEKTDLFYEAGWKVYFNEISKNQM